MKINAMNCVEQSRNAPASKLNWTTLIDLFLSLQSVFRQNFKHFRPRFTNTFAVGLVPNYNLRLKAHHRQLPEHMPHFIFDCNFIIHMLFPSIHLLTLAFFHFLYCSQLGSDSHTIKKYLILKFDFHYVPLSLLVLPAVSVQNPLQPALPLCLV